MKIPRHVALEMLKTQMLLMMGPSDEDDTDDEDEILADRLQAAESIPEVIDLVVLDEEDTFDVLIEVLECFIGADWHLPMEEEEALDLVNRTNSAWIPILRKGVRL